MPGWSERSLFISREGRVSFYHYDFYSQALSKIERGHAQDDTDVQSMVGDGLVIRQRLVDCSRRSRASCIGILPSIRRHSRTGSPRSSAADAIGDSQP